MYAQRCVQPSNTNHPNTSFKKDFIVTIFTIVTIDKGSTELLKLFEYVKTAVWCNGSTRDSGSLSLGSSPGTATLVKLKTIK